MGIREINGGEYGHHNTLDNICEIDKNAIQM